MGVRLRSAWLLAAVLLMMSVSALSEGARAMAHLAADYLLMKAPAVRRR